MFTSFNNLEIEMTLKQAESCSKPGQDAEPDVLVLMQDPKIRRQRKRIDPELIRQELSEYGCYSEEELADTASDALYNIRKSIATARSKAREKLDEMLRSQTKQKYLQEQVITMRDGRFVVPVKAEHKGDVPGLVHDTSQSGATLS